MIFKTAHENVWCYRIIYMVPVVLLCILLSAVIPLPGTLSRAVVVCITSMIGIALFITVSIYLRLYYRRFRYAVLSNRLYITSGVFYHSQRQIPLNAIRSIHVLCGPLERRQQITTIIVKATGMMVILDGISKAQLDELTHQLSCL